jgi:4-hydroxy-2-oxoheptanedioate aldolase
MSSFTGLRARLHTPGPLFWALMVIPEPAIASILGFSGVDYVLIDAEHGPFTLSSLRPCIDALKATPASIVIRTASSRHVEIQQLLDLGADGVLAPHIESAEEAASVVKAARYPPDGARGLGEGIRATRYGLDEEAYWRDANRSVAVMVIVESRLGVEHASEIIGVPGLDAIYVGPGDLAADLGVLGEPESELLDRSIDSVVGETLDVGLKVFARPQPRSAAEHESMLIYCFTDAMVFTAAVGDAVERARTEWRAGQVASP